MLGSTKDAKKRQRALDVAHTRTRADALMRASNDRGHTLIERAFMEARGIELREMACILERAVIE